MSSVYEYKNRFPFQGEPSKAIGCALNILGGQRLTVRQCGDNQLQFMSNKPRYNFSRKYGILREPLTYVASATITIMDGWVSVEARLFFWHAFLNGFARIAFGSAVLSLIIYLAARKSEPTVPVQVFLYPLMVMMAFVTLLSLSSPSRAQREAKVALEMLLRQMAESADNPQQ